MPSVTVFAGNSAIRKYEFNKDYVTIGRNAGADIIKDRISDRVEQAHFHRTVKRPHGGERCRLSR